MPADFDFENMNQRGPHSLAGEAAARVDAMKLTVATGGDAGLVGATLFAGALP